MNNKNSILCDSLIRGGICEQGLYCNFCHDIKQQNINPDRLLALKIIFDDDIKNLSEYADNKKEIIYDNLKILCKLCNNCQNHCCVGGYNCCEGAINASIKICRSNMMTGTCPNDSPNKKRRKPDKELINILSNKINFSEDYGGCKNGFHPCDKGIEAICVWEEKKNKNVKIYDIKYEESSSEEFSID
jgi:hypothetical protein